MKLLRLKLGNREKAPMNHQKMTHHPVMIHHPAMNRPLRARHTESKCMSWLHWSLWDCPCLVSQYVISRDRVIELADWLIFSIFHIPIFLIFLILLSTAHLK